MKNTHSFLVAAKLVKYCKSQCFLTGTQSEVYTTNLFLQRISASYHQEGNTDIVIRPSFKTLNVSSTSRQLSVFLWFFCYEDLTTKRNADSVMC